MKTRQEWIASLAAASPTIDAMKLDRLPNGDLDIDGYNLANDEQHKSLIIRGIENLCRRPSAREMYVHDLLKEMITQESPYGIFSELAAYDWLIRSNIQISAQIELTPSEVLGANGTVLDGVIDYCGIYFDIKAFGFHGYLARRLKEKLERELTGQIVFVEESWELSVEMFQKLIADFRKIAESLRRKKSLSFGRLRIRMEDPKPVHVSAITVDPFLLARENYKYAFHSANQFTRNSPFMLIFVLHPWFSAVHHDFAGGDSAFTRALARRTFMQFTNDTNPVSEVCPKVTSGTTFGDAARLLSAIIFVNVWPEESYARDTIKNKLVPSWVYLNPRATHPITRETARLFAHLNPHIGIDDFVYDNY